MKLGGISDAQWGIDAHGEVIIRIETDLHAIQHVILLEQVVHKVCGDRHAPFLYHGDKDDHLVVGNIQGQNDLNVLQVCAGEMNHPDSG